MKRLYKVITVTRQRLTGGGIRRSARHMDPTARAALSACVQEEQEATDPEWQQLDRELTEARQQLAQAEKQEAFVEIRCQQYRRALDQQARLLQQEDREIRRLQKERDDPIPDTIDEKQHPEEQKTPENGEATALIDAKEDGGNDPLDIEALEMQPNQNGVEVSLDPPSSIHPQSEEQAVDLDTRIENLERRQEAWERDVEALEQVRFKHKEIIAYSEEIRRKIKALEKKKQAIESLRKECDEFLTASAGNNTELPHNPDESPQLQSDDNTGDVELGETVMMLGGDDENGIDDPDRSTLEENEVEGTSLNERP